MFDIAVKKFFPFKLFYDGDRYHIETSPLICRANNICFCVNSSPRSRNDPSHFRKIKLHPARDRVEQCIVNTVFKY